MCQKKEVTISRVFLNADDANSADFIFKINCLIGLYSLITYVNTDYAHSKDKLFLFNLFLL